jgi:hypothetical protein
MPALSELLMQAVADKVWPQGRPFVEPNPKGGVTYGKRFGGGDRDEEYSRSPTIGSIKLEDRREVVSKCETSLHYAVKAAVALTGMGTFRGVVDRSAREIIASGIGGAAVATGIRVVEEVCSQTVVSLNERIALLDKMASEAPQKPKPQS